MNIFFFFSFILFFLKTKIIDCNNTTNNITCFEYSCAVCDSEYYGACTECRPGFHLIDGTCPCADSSCALCKTGLAGLSICKVCKDGYYRKNDDCLCEVEHCEICVENGCKRCYEGYFYNSTTNTCDKKEDEDETKMKCFDENCDICISEEQGACDTCKKGYYYKKGECFKSPEPNNKECEKGFYYSDGVCESLCLGVDCNVNEIFYYTCPINPCLVCSDNELKIFTECNNSAICTREGCLNCIDNDYCLLCDQGYYLISGICRRCPSGCSICNNNDTCQYCLSGFTLNTENKCELIENNKNDFDFPIKRYNKYKNQLLKENYPNVPIIEEEIEIVIECDSNCVKCYDNDGKCIECAELHILENNKCVKHCSNENCLNCFMRYGSEICTECEGGYYVKNSKCAYNCSDSNCLSCYLLDGNEICTQCSANYELKDLKCKKSTKFIIAIFLLLIFFFIVISIMCFFYYRQKLIERRRQLMRDNNEPQVIPYNLDGNDSSRRSINKEEILEEFEKVKVINEKGNQVCHFCKKKPGKFQCDCETGCILCKEHSTLKTIEDKGQSIQVCCNCNKPAKKVNPIKKDCNICLQKKSNIVHFKCGCAFEVCKECYVKSRMESDKCPEIGRAHV